MLFYFLSFFIFVFSIFKYDSWKNGVQISNFIFSFILIFEVCIKISDSEKFKLWIGSNLDQSIRYLIMFVICLNCTYFFTRITGQIIDSSGI